MRILLLTLCMLVCPPAQGRDSVSIVFWNLENFFDYFDDEAGDSDSEFSSRGARRWTKRRFAAKCNAVAKSLLWMGESRGRMPDIVTVAEVENRFVMKKLLDLTPLWKFGYRIVHYDSPDPRGIDVALLYREGRLSLESSRPCRIDSIATRDILLARFVTEGGDSLALTVNHHPSKHGGDASQGRRIMALKRLDSLADTLQMQGWSHMVAIGDFNDTPGLSHL